VNIIIETGFVENGFAVALCLCTSCSANTRHASAIVSLATRKVSMSNSLRLNQGNGLISTEWSHLFIAKSISVETST